MSTQNITCVCVYTVRLGSFWVSGVELCSVMDLWRNLCATTHKLSFALFKNNALSLRLSLWVRQSSFVCRAYCITANSDLLKDDSII